MHEHIGDRKENTLVTHFILLRITPHLILLCKCYTLSSTAFTICTQVFMIGE